MDMASTVAKGGAAVPKLPATHGAIPLDRGMPRRIFISIGQSGGIAIDRNESARLRLERPGTTAIPLKGGSDNAVRDAKLDKAARGFEAIFLRQLFRAMRTTVPGAGPYGNGSAGEIYSDMIENGLSESMSEQGRLGIARMLQKQFKTGQKTELPGTVAPASVPQPDSVSATGSFPGP